MKLLPGHPRLWAYLLVLCVSQSETEPDYPDVCEMDREPGNIIPQMSSGNQYVGVAHLNDNFRCLFYTTNLLNCSWSFHTLQKDAQLFVHISICDDDREVHYANLSSEERVGSLSLTLHKNEMLSVILHLNITLHGNWTVYTSEYDMDLLEVQPPPQNITASFGDGGLLVTWGLPQGRTVSNEHCFEYQLDLGDQESPKKITGSRSYMEPNADPTYTYSVRVRTRKTNLCTSPSHWSDWSDPITVATSVYKFNTLVIFSISLGTPMILLAGLLLLRHQRVCSVLFPPIPRPPQKYKGMLEKGDTFNLHHAAPPAEEITTVLCTEQRPEKTF
ncbi:granulocyte-macrophage colony-stimulating factor receptor subunit alpha-like [Pungitius pungitius]|uniref:granulocyte-macrophage colony-stimulating factor receptor subunit alpha-like n=1 Tax=Pungitius pungitius TaxID=134920 RepID=UPI002E11B34A